MMTVYDKGRENWDNLARQGKPHLAEMAKYFETEAEMDVFFGSNGGVRKWCLGLNSAQKQSDIVAKLWLDSNRRSPTPAHSIEKKNSSVLIMMTVPEGKMDKIRVVANALGCELIE